MFYLSRLVVEILSPFNLSLLLFVTALFSLIFKYRKVSILLLTLGLSIQLMCGYGLVVRSQISAKERVYSALSEKELGELLDLHIDSIVVLGSGHVSDPDLPVTSQIGGSSLFRLVEGLRLAHSFSDSRLILSGGKGYDPVANAEIVSRVARKIGFDENRIVVENRPRDTLQEAELLSELLGSKSFILVTSALHMPRAMAIFEAQGMRPIAAPTDYIFKNHHVVPPGDIFPSTSNIELSRRMFYEWIGSLWKELQKII